MEASNPWSDRWGYNVRWACHNSIYHSRTRPIHEDEIQASRKITGHLSISAIQIFFCLEPDKETQQKKRPMSKVVCVVDLISWQREIEACRNMVLYSIRESGVQVDWRFLSFPSSFQMTVLSIRNLHAGSGSNTREVRIQYVRVIAFQA